MRRWLLLAAVLLAASCAAAPDANPQLEAPNSALLVPPVAASACQVGPNGGPVLAERGIGGTGMPGAAVPASTAVKTVPPAGSDRGVGGTGLTAGTALASAGIAGEITGFASICVNGVEVQYNAATPVAADGAPVPHDALRAGQIVAIAATRDQDRLSAERVEIRHEVVGPIWAVTRQGLIVAGQNIVLTRKTLGSMDQKPGGWFAVSGLRNMDGVIMATRVDAVPVGQVTVHGALAGRPGSYRIGALVLHVSPDVAGLGMGESVTVTGILVGGVLQVSSITPDLLYQDPTAYFGPGADWFLLEAYSTHTDGTLELAGGLRAPAAAPATQGPTIFSFTRGEAGGLQVQGDWAPHNVPAAPGLAPAGADVGAFPGPGNMGPMLGQGPGMPGMPGIPGMPGMGPVPGVGFGGGGMGGVPH